MGARANGTPVSGASAVQLSERVALGAMALVETDELFSSHEEDDAGKDGLQPTNVH